MKRIPIYFLSGADERDERFRKELQQSSQRGLFVLGLLELGIALLSGAVTTAAVAVATSLIARLSWSRTRARPLALLATFAGAAALIRAPAPHWALAALLLGAVALQYFQPWQTAALGVAITALAAAAGAGHIVFLLILTVLCAGISAELYARRRADYYARQEAVRVAETLAGAQLRAQLAENAMAIGKLAAALTHEINSPLGTLKSSIDTLLVLAGRQFTAPPEQRGHLVEMQAELRRSIQSSSERIQDVVARLQRFIGLEDTEVKDADVNELLSDTAVLLQEQLQQDKIRLEFDLQPLPNLNCRPQLLSAAFYSLLSNAIDAVNGDGRIRVSTRGMDSQVEIRIEDNGRGMPPDEVESMFDPSFKVSGERVRSGNWSLFSSRQIVFEHGGDIRISSTEGK